MKGIAVITKYLVNRKINLFAVLSVAAALLLAGCGGSPSAPASTPTTAGTSTSTTAHATLKHMPNGMATVSFDLASQSLTVKISLIGLAPNSTHPAHIHSGSCANQGAVVYPLQNVIADAHGVGASTTVIQKVTDVPASGWYINVHNGPGLSPSEQFFSRPLAVWKIGQVGSAVGQVREGLARFLLQRGERDSLVTDDHAERTN